MTNLTTAAGFATFIITNSEIIERVWYHILIKYSCPILFMCLIIIPIYYSYQPVHKKSTWDIWAAITLKCSWLGLKNGKNTIDVHVYLVAIFFILMLQLVAKK
jgi:hypothetical protein